MDGEKELLLLYQGNMESKYYILVWTLLHFVRGLFGKCLVLSQWVLGCIPGHIVQGLKYGLVNKATQNRIPILLHWNLLHSPNLHKLSCAPAQILSIAKKCVRGRRL